MTEKPTDFQQLIDYVLQQAKTLGATAAAAEVSESSGLSVSCRKGQLETVERNRDRGLGITVYNGQSRGSASSSDFSQEALTQTVQAAWNIARYTAADEAAGLPDAADLATEFPDLELYKPWDIDPDQALQIALEAETAALEYDQAISNSEGAQINTHQGRFLMGNSLGFRGGYADTHHSLSVSVIAGQGSRMQRDYWYSSHRYPERLMAAKDLGQYAAKRTMDRLNAKRLKTGKYPVLFEAPLAIGLIGHLTQAISGAALYRKASFLLDALQTSVFADHISILEDPFIKGAMGSSAFDSEGVRTRKRQLIAQGVLQGYLLSSYTARKLGMHTTGNCGGSHNLVLQSSLTQASDNLAAMLKKMDRGLLVTELIGQGVNYVTGDYSRGAFGYWVENGEIQYPVQEITIAGNLKEMYQNIAAVGADTLTRGSKTSGSILIAEMQVAGQ
ncbi:metalloprotease PmbA [Brackiella oedipodis]|uniref:metalloprotease PmbA n=1 Tax=Brackiella oedipodis TaxID=124225 RepID=UPI0004921F83|nr:metalloprotease PmbA [Brackiella oedipodis]